MILVLCFFGIDAFAQNNVQKRPSLNVRFNFQYLGLDQKIQIFRSHKHSSGKGYQLVNAIKQINLIKPSENNEVIVYSEDSVDLAFVVHNNNRDSLYFYTGNHTFDPVINSVGLSINPPSSGVVAGVPPGKYFVFYGSVSVKGLSEDKTLSVNIPIVGLTESELKRLTNSNPEFEGE
jgi:hypothetical protein